MLPSSKVNVNVWVEKYRPTRFDNIILDDINRQILNNMLERMYIPNLLLYGPPGTGKTTTILNLIRAYQPRAGAIYPYGLVLSLNGSDTKGIDVIRGQINQFVSSHPLFQNGMKFVIIDEVDYMTKSAQQALRYLLQEYSTNVRFCLICNYISKIDDGLQNEFIKLRFNHLPPAEVFQFLQNIRDKENLTHFTDDALRNIQTYYGSDIRSMINFMQSNTSPTLTPTSQVWKDILVSLQSKEVSMSDMEHRMYELTHQFGMDQQTIIHHLFTFLLRSPDTQQMFMTPAFLAKVKNILHTPSLVSSQQAFAYVLHAIRDRIEDCTGGEQDTVDETL